MKARLAFKLNGDGVRVGTVAIILCGCKDLQSANCTCAVLGFLLLAVSKSCVNILTLKRKKRVLTCRQMFKMDFECFTDIVKERLQTFAGKS